MDLHCQLSPLGAALSLLLILFAWGVSIAVGMLLLPNRKALSSRLGHLALSGPWGLMFLVGLLAAFKSGGRTMLLSRPEDTPTFASRHFLGTRPVRLGMSAV